ncbi:MAG: RNA-binding transcriptional accessory protein [Flavobacteriaceae bacterium]|nr:RNA-binding transcriptional accessory protein [Flavobacteriaceae bacterium]
MSLISFIKNNTRLDTTKITNTVSMLNQDYSIPFISRYRKEKTGGLNEVDIFEIEKSKKNYEELSKRKEYILKTLNERGVSDSSLFDNINKTQSLSDLEDYYLPHKKKRKTKAEVARKNGLEPLAQKIMEDTNMNISKYADSFTNENIKNKDEVLEGARHIISEWVSENMLIRNGLRRRFSEGATVVSKVVKSKEKDPKAQKYRDYFNMTTNISKCSSHRLLAILRAENEGFIKTKTTIDKEVSISFIERKLAKGNSQSTEQIKLAIADSYKRLLEPAISNETLSLYRTKAEDIAIKVFSTNLEQLLLSSPLSGKNILAIDPGFRSGCKVVSLNKQGDFLKYNTIYPHEPQMKYLEAADTVANHIKKYNIEAIAIGNGTASRETEEFINKLNLDSDISVFVVSEAGASIYSASEVAREEFPDIDLTQRGAISIGRRLADPLAELVKIDAKSIGVGQYQHDVDATKLKSELDNTVEHCVNKVGVNLNTASKYLLSYVSGIGPKLAENIVVYRTENGAFTDRKQLRKVKRLGDKAYEQSIAFLRIENAKNPLDNTRIHPERYSLINKIAKDNNIDLASLISNKDLLDSIDVSVYKDENIGVSTLKDIIDELKKPGLDPREPLKNFEFDKSIKTINDLKTGDILPGIVNNITNFGCFVDIGIKESGLVHVSKLSNNFVKDINDIVKLQQQVEVRVEEVDLERKRIQLSMCF